ncbi:MAG: hypothetical protein OXP28_09410 [Gammaproteobacteria bacterium]|nr:hypothetical protein [Gammaproteobacteria bacterium]
MAVDDLSESLRTSDKFHHIDLGFINQRLCLGALDARVREALVPRFRPEQNNLDRMVNGHLLVTALLDCCEAVGAPTLLEAIRLGGPRRLFRSTERLAPCPEIYEVERVSHNVQLDVDVGKPVRIAYHTSHLVSDTGKMELARGAKEGGASSIVGVLNYRKDYYEIEPLVIGAPWFDHPRNGDDNYLMFAGYDFGEILPEDIEQFARMSDVEVTRDDEWMGAMRTLSEDRVKSLIVGLLAETPKEDWGGEQDDHYSGNVTVGGARRTASFMFKGPGNGFREMTLEMCGKRADQIHRMVGTQADLSIVQHCHQIGPTVRQTLRSLVVYPGGSRRKYCVIDGLATFRILKAYSLV